MSKLRGKHQSELFSFFCLEPVPELSDKKAMKIGFKPTGEALRDFTTLFCLLDDKDQIESMELIIKRSFLDDPVQGIFAADLAKSFLYGVIGRENASSIRALAAEIESRAVTTRPRLVAAANSGADTKNMPPSPGYRAFRGETNLEQISSGSYILKLNNIDLDGLRALSMNIEKVESSWVKRILNLFTFLAA